MAGKTPEQQRIDIAQELLDRQLAWKGYLVILKKRQKDPLTLRRFCYRYGFWESDISRKSNGEQRSTVSYIDKVDRAFAREMKKDCS